MPKEEEEEDKQQQKNQTNKRDRRSEKYTTQLMLLVSILFKCNNIDYFVQTFQYICWYFFHYENNHFCVLYYVYRFIGSMSQQVQNGTNTVAYVVATLGRLSVISSAYVLTLILMHGQSIDKDSAKIHLIKIKQKQIEAEIIHNIYTYMHTHMLAHTRSLAHNTHAYHATQHVHTYIHIWCLS